MTSVPTPFVEQVRERALADDPDAPLDFYRAAIDLGASAGEAEQIDDALSLRVMRSRGAI